LNSKFEFFIEKADASNDGDDLIISGVASSTNVDHDSERMSLNALQQMANKINTEGVPLRIEHQKADEAVVGEVIGAEVDSRNRLLIKAKVNKDNPAGLMLHNALKGGLKMGFSVGGRVKRAYRELAEGAGKLVKTFYDIMLDEVSVTPRPANYDSWANTYGVLAKSETLQPILYSQFLTQNPKLDYLAVIEKSIPDQAWEKVETKDENNTMAKKDIEDMKETEEKAESTTSEMEEKAESMTSESEEKAESTEEEEKAETTEEETSSEKSASIKYVDAKFNTVISLLKSIKKDLGPETTSDEDTESPEKKARKTGANGDDGKKISPNDAVDQENPDEDKSDPEVTPKSRKARKAWPTETEEKADETSETEEKAEDSEESEEK
ncbi:MAG: hypothetical protein ACRDF4_10570, partial [Rhabdochlamydiaceae bacterium]